MSRRIQYRPKAIAKLRNQTRQPAAARCPGRTSLEIGPLPTPLPRSTQMERSLEKRSAHHRRSAQKSHRRPSPPVGGGSVARAHRPAHPKAIGIRNLNKAQNKKGKGDSRGTVALLAHWSVRGAPEVLTCSRQHLRASH